MTLTEKGGVIKEKFTSRLLGSVKTYLYTVLKIVISIASIFAFFYFFRWTGWRGFIAFIIGMGIMAYLLLSKNIMLMTIIKMTSSEGFLDDIRGEDEINKKDD